MSGSTEQKADRARGRDLLRLPLTQLIKQLGDQVRDGKASRVAASTGRFSAQEPIRVFLSYARPDEQTVSRLFDRLCSDGFQPWMDIKSLRPGQKWRPAIESAIRGTDFFLLCLSKHSV